MADLEGRFEAAVKVIRSMPKKGAYQPSYDTMLKFYGYFKQAKEGKCREAKPGFWDVVKKAKWEAWSSLGNISREEAMECYVNELKKVMETMPNTEEMAEFSVVLKSFYEAVYEPNSEEPPNVLRIFKTPVKSTEEANGYGHSYDTVINNSQSFHEGSKIFENCKEETTAKVYEAQESQSKDVNNGSVEVDDQMFNHNSDHTINGQSKTHENAWDVDNSLENVGDSIENLSEIHSTGLQPKHLYIVEVSSNKKGFPLENNSQDLKDNAGQNLQAGFKQNNVKDYGQPDKLSSISDESEDEEFCDSLDPEHLSVLQSGTIRSPVVKMNKLNGTTDSHNSGESTCSPEHLHGSSLTECDTSNLEDEVSTVTKRYISTPSEKKPAHVKFDLEKNLLTKDNHKDSNGRSSESVHEPHFAQNTYCGLEALNHQNGGILKVKQVGSGYKGGDGSKTLRRPPTSSGFSQARRHQGQSVRSNGERLEDSRMMAGQSAGHSDSDSDDTNPNGESCDSCCERDEINERIVIALERLQQDVSRVLRRLGTMEDVMALRQERIQNINTYGSRHKGPWWRQFIPSKTVAFLILWPFIINLVFYYWKRQKARKS